MAGDDRVPHLDVFAKYAAAFADNEIELDDLADLTEEDLEKLGLPMGPRKRFLRALASGEPSSPSVSKTGPQPHLREGDESGGYSIVWHDM